MSKPSEPDESHDDPNVIRKQIEETRDRIADTAEALAYKTDVPARVKENVSDRVDSVKSALGGAASSVAHGLSDASHSASAIAADASVKLSQGVHDVSQSAKTNLGGAASSLDDKTANVKSKLADASGNVKGSLDDATQNLRTNVSQLGTAAQEKLADSGEATKSLAFSTKGFLEKNPLGLAIGSLAAGFLLGLALPVSDLERDNVGPIGEKVKDQAKSAATEMVAQGKAAVATAVSDALTPTKK